MERWVRIIPALALAALAACDPYHRRQGEFYAGPVDPVNFAPPYLGTGADRYSTGKGRFNALRAYVNGAEVQYFSFPFTEAQLGAADPLVLGEDETPTPSAYVFDPAPPSPYPAAPGCKPPNGYVYDLGRDGIRYDEQGAIFTALPEADYVGGSEASWSYIPVVAQVPVTSAGNECQEIKSEKTLMFRRGVGVEKQPAPPGEDGLVGVPDGSYLAWAIIDPGSPVYRVGETPTTSNGLTFQRWGWFKHYLLAYIDGGYVPIDGSTPGVAKMITQRLYYPDSVGLGGGSDVMQFARGQAGYSPVCEVRSYPGAPSTDVGVIDPISVPADPPYVYCLQPLP